MIKWTHVVIGVVIYFVLQIVIGFLAGMLGLVSAATISIFMIVVGILSALLAGVYVGYMVNKDMKISFINGALAGFIGGLVNLVLTVLSGVPIDIFTALGFIVGLIIASVSVGIGAVVGQLIKGKPSNPPETVS